MSNSALPDYLAARLSCSYPPDGMIMSTSLNLKFRTNLGREAEEEVAGILYAFALGTEDSLLASIHKGFFYSNKTVLASFNTPRITSIDVIIACKH